VATPVDNQVAELHQTDCKLKKSSSAKQTLQILQEKPISTFFKRGVETISHFTFFTAQYSDIINL